MNQSIKFLCTALLICSITYTTPVQAYDTRLVQQTLSNISQLLQSIKGSLFGMVAGASTSVPEYPSLRQLTGNDNPTLAFNYSGHCDWCPAQPFLDIMKVTREWVGNGPGGWGEEELLAGGYLDENGWPTAIPPELSSISAVWALGWARDGVVGFADFDQNRVLGRYRMTYEGEGSFSFLSFRVLEEGEGYKILEVDKPQNHIIYITETDPNGTGNYLRNIEIVKEEHIDLHESGAVYNPDYLKKIQDARLLRFLTATNSTVNDFDEEPTKDWYRAGTGFEYYIQLVNEAGIDPWFTFPFNATDAYIEEFAELVKRELDPNLVAHFELSNEVWNWAFQQTHQANAKGQIEFGTTGGTTWIDYYSKRSYEVMKIVTDVYGDELDARAKRVVGTQTANMGITKAVLNARNWQTSDPDNYVVPHTMFDAIAATTYFGSRLVTNETTRDVIIEAIKDDSVDNDAFLKDMLRGNTPYEINLMQKVLTDLQAIKAELVTQGADLDLILYEGGQHVHHSFATNIPEEDIALLEDSLINFVRSQEMADLYQELWDIWETVGDGPFMQFGDVSSPGRWGSWALYANLDDSSPRSNLLETLNATTDPWWSGAVAGSFRQQGYTTTGTNSANTMSGSVQEDYLIGLAGDDTLYAGPGNDGINGGPGNDTALFKGDKSEYTITPEGKGHRVVGPDGSDYLYGVETLHFEDGETYQINTGEGIQPLYAISDTLVTRAATPYFNTASGTSKGTFENRTLVRVVSSSEVASSTWYEIKARDGITGFIPETSVQPAEALKRIKGEGERRLLHKNETDIDNNNVDDDLEDTIFSLMNAVKSGERFNTLRVHNQLQKIRTFLNKRERDVQTDQDYDYPLGLYEFTAEVNPGATTTVTIYLDDEYTTDDWTYRKYNGRTYIDISDQVTYNTATVDGNTVTTVSYDVLDNGPLDLDDRLGFILDPAGPAVPEEEEEEEVSSSGSSSGGGGGGSSRSSSNDDEEPTQVGGNSGSPTAPTTPARTPVTPTPVTPPTSTTIPSTFTFNNNISFIQPELNLQSDVRYLQQFLNDFEGESLTVNGVYDSASNEAMKRFQRKYAREILDVWNLTDATGYVGITSRLKMNFLLKGQSAQCPVFTEFNGGLNGIYTSDEVRRTKEVLADLDMYSGPLDRVWTPQTHEALITFQETFREVMLDPWNITEGTGYKYKTTNKFLNYFVGCDTGAVELEGIGVYEGI